MTRFVSDQDMQGMRVIIISLYPSWTILFPFIAELTAIHIITKTVNLFPQFRSIGEQYVKVTFKMVVQLGGIHHDANLLVFK